MKVLVVTQCTGSKARTSERQLRPDDFLDPNRMAQKERELAALRLPAEQMYTGMQHIDVRSGLQRLRDAGVDVTLSIVSAGYGLIPGDQEIAPYEATFQGANQRSIRERGRRLGIPQALRRAIADSEIVFVLLGKDYLTAADPPLVGRNSQRMIAITSQTGERFWRGNVTVFQTTVGMCTQFHAGAI